MDLSKNTKRMAMFTAAAGALALVSQPAQAQDLGDALEQWGKSIIFDRVTGAVEDGIYGDRPDCYKRENRTTTSGVYTGSQGTRTYQCDDRYYYPDVRNGPPASTYPYGYGGYGGGVPAPVITMPAQGYSNPYDAAVNTALQREMALRQAAEREALRRRPFVSSAVPATDTRPSLSEEAFQAVVNECVADQARANPGASYRTIQSQCQSQTGQAFKVRGH